jgi:hypothetical protein
MAATQTQQPKADREAAGKKAAATRERNEKRATSKDAGRKAAATRQRNDAVKAAKRARKDVGDGAGKIVSAGRSVGEAVVLTGRSVATRVGIGPTK